MSIDEYMNLQNTPGIPLHEDLISHITDGSLGKMIHHPLMIEIMYREEAHGWYNKRYEAVKKRSVELLNSSNFSGYVFSHERPYRLDAFLLIDSEIESDEEYWSLVRQIWIDSENIHENYYAWEDIWNYRGGREFVMDSDEREVLKHLPDMVRIFRGVQSEMYPNGMSWSLEKKKAAWFAKRFGSPGYVISATVPKNLIKAYFSARNEDEIVFVDSITVEIIEEV